MPKILNPSRRRKYDRERRKPPAGADYFTPREPILEHQMSLKDRKRSSDKQPELFCNPSRSNAIAGTPQKSSNQVLNSQQLATDTKPTRRQEHIDASNEVWAKVYTPHEPDDPLDLCVQTSSLPSTCPSEHALRSFTKAAATVNKEDQTAGRTRSEEEQQWWSTKLKIVAFNYVHEIRITQLTSESRAFGTASAAYQGADTVAQMAATQAQDAAAGWKFPGGHSASYVANPTTLTVRVQRQAQGFFRDHFDNTSVYAAFYPPAAYALEHGHNGINTMHIHGAAFNHKYDRFRDGDYRYVLEHEVDWLEVAAAGGLGDLVVVGDEELLAFAEAKFLDKADVEARIVGGRLPKFTPWETRRMAHDACLLW